jgi:hypothetical protein
MEAGAIALGIGIALLNSGGIKDSLAKQAQLRSLVAINQEQVQAQQILQEKQKGLEPIALERYQKGCEMVLSFDVSGQYKVLSVGSPVIDGNVAAKVKNLPVNKLPLSAVLPAGSTVCDAYGNTSVLENNAQGFPVVQSIASTSDREVVATAMQRVRARRAGVLK